MNLLLSCLSVCTVNMKYYLYCKLEINFFYNIVILKLTRKCYHKFAWILRFYILNIYSSKINISKKKFLVIFSISGKRVDI